MRYYKINMIRGDSFLNRMQFDKRRPWLDVDAPECTLTLRLLGEGAATESVYFEDREGRRIPHKTLPDAHPPADWPDVAHVREDRRQHLRVQVSFSGPLPIYLRRASKGTLLLTLEPVVENPEFLFSLMRETTNGFCPEGFRNFVETGTLLGHTTLHASYWFERVWTIELSQELWQLARESLKHRTNITCLHGNSGDLLPDLMAELAGPSFFFLDAHWSGDETVDWRNSRFSGYPVKTARLKSPALSESSQQVPLLAELEAIADRHIGKAVVLIDDWGSVGQKDFGFCGQDYSDVSAETVLKLFAAHERTRFFLPVPPKRFLWAIA